VSRLYLQLLPEQEEEPGVTETPTCDAPTRQTFHLFDPNTYSRWLMIARAVASFLTDFFFFRLSLR
jgi:hypothetical protein